MSEKEPLESPISPISPTAREPPPATTISADHIQFHTEDLVQFSFELKNDHLGRVITQIIQAIQVGTRKTAELTAEVFQNRRKIQAFTEEVRAKFVQEEAAREKLKRLIERVGDNLRRVEDQSITRADFDSRARQIQQNIQAISDRLTETETTGGKKIVSHVESYVRRHVQGWYDPIRAAEEKELNSRLTELNSELLTTFRGEMTALRDIQDMRTGEVAAKAAKDLKSAIANREAAERNIQQTREMDMQQMSAQVRGVDEHHRKVQKEFQQRSHERMTEAEARVSALYHGQCLNEDELRDIWEEYQKIVQVPGGGADVADSSLDRRVEVLHNTKPWLELRAKCQLDIRTRLNQVKEEDQDDFSKQITELQRELRSKVGPQRVLELLEENSDKALYANVDLVKQKIQQLEEAKVSHSDFNEAMRSKGDAKKLEEKADRGFVSQLGEFLQGKIDALRDQLKQDLAKAMIPKESPVSPRGRTPASRQSFRKQGAPRVDPHHRGSVTPAAERPVGLWGPEPSPTAWDDRGDSSPVMELQDEQMLSIVGSPRGRRQSMTNLRATSPTAGLKRRQSASPPPKQRVPIKPINPAAKPIGIIDAALNPKPEFQWFSEAQGRQGLAPRGNKGGAGGTATPYAYDQTRGVDARGEKQAGQLPREGSRRKSLAKRQDSAGGSPRTGSPTGSSHGGGADSPRAQDAQVALPPLAQGPPNRSQSEYARAVESAPARHASAGPGLQKNRPSFTRSGPTSPTSAGDLRRQSHPAPPSTAPEGSRRPQL